MLIFTLNFLNIISPERPHFRTVISKVKVILCHDSAVQIPYLAPSIGASEASHMMEALHSTAPDPMWTSPKAPEHSSDYYVTSCIGLSSVLSYSLPN